MQSNTEEQFYLYFPSRDEIVYNDGKSKVRRIYEGHIELDPEELSALAAFETYLNQKKIQSPDLSQAAKLRMLYATKFKHDKTVQALQAYVQWRQTSLPPVETEEALQFLKNGGVYTLGRDNRYRPIIVVNALNLAVKNLNIESVLLALTMLFEHILANIMLPGQIENWYKLLERKGCNPRSGRIGDYLSTQTITTESDGLFEMYKCYVVRCPKTITMSWGMIKGFLEEVTVRKISFYNNQIPTPIFEHTHPSQIEVQFGGQQPTLTTYWPPKLYSTQFIIENDKLPEMLVSREKYMEMYTSGYLKNNKICEAIIEKELFKQKQFEDEKRRIEAEQKKKQQEKIDKLQQLINQEDNIPNPLMSDINNELFAPAPPLKTNISNETPYNALQEECIQSIYSSNFKVKLVQHQQNF